MILTPNKSNIPFFEAPQWNQNIAIAKADFLELSEEVIQVQGAELGTVRALKRFLSAFNRGLTGKEIKEKLRGKPVSKSKYYRWLKAYEREGLSGLLDKYNNGGPRIPSEIRQAIERLIWENHECRFKDVHEDLCVIFSKDKVPCYTTIRDHVKRYKEKNWAALVLHHEGQKGLRDRNMAVALGRMDADLIEPNAKWEIDTTVADQFTRRTVTDVVCITKDGKRCKLIGIEDIFSRSLKYHLTEKETALVVGQVIRDRILMWGVPKEIVIDNGKPYKNRRVLHFLESIGVTVRICTPGSPEEKPHIERAFRTLSEKLFRRLVGYSGNCVQTRPSEIEIRYTMAEAQRVIDEYVDNVYAENVHRSTGQRPRERMAQPGFTPRTIPERELDILLMEEYERRVRQGHIDCQNGKYFHQRLPEGQKVQICINDFDASEVIVFKNNRFLCVAEDPARKGWTPQQIKESKKKRNQELRTRIKAHEALIDKRSPKDARIHALIDHHKKLKPVEFPKKAEVINFPELKNISYIRPDVGSTAPEESIATTGETQESKLIQNNQEYYLDIMKRKQSGQLLDELDHAFLEEFLTSNEYRLLGSHLRKELTRRAS